MQKDKIFWIIAFFSLVILPQVHAVVTNYTFLNNSLQAGSDFCNGTGIPSSNTLKTFNFTGRLGITNGSRSNGMNGTTGYKGFCALQTGRSVGGTEFAYAILNMPAVSSNNPVENQSCIVVWVNSTQGRNLASNGGAIYRWGDATNLVSSSLWWKDFGQSLANRSNIIFDSGGTHTNTPENDISTSVNDKLIPPYYWEMFAVDGQRSNFTIYNTNVSKVSGYAPTLQRRVLNSSGASNKMRKGLHFSIGNDQQATNNNFIGKIGMIAVFNNSCTQLMLTRLYGNGTKPLTVWNITHGITTTSVDSTKPFVNLSFPRKSNITLANTLMRLAVNATDTGGGIANGWVNVTQPGKALQKITLVKNGATTQWNTTVRVTNVTRGTANITFTINDTSGNKNATVKTLYNITDSLIESGIRPITGSRIGRNSKMNFSENVTSISITVANVSVNISGTGYFRQRQMKLSSGNIYNLSGWFAPNITGAYTIKVDSRDILNKHNTSSTSTFNIYSGIILNQTINNHTVEWHNNISVRFNVSSNLSATTRWRMNDTTHFIMNAITGLFTNNGLFSKLTTYLVRLTVNDSYSFNNKSVVIRVVINDSKAPAVKFLNITPRLMEYGQKINFSANVSDPHSVKFVNFTINTTGYTKNYSTTRNGITYNLSLTTPFKKLGKWTFRPYTKDNTSNFNGSIFLTFRVNDTTKPNLIIQNPPANLWQKKNQSFFYNVSDTFDINNVTFYLFNGSTKTNRTIYRIPTSKVNPNNFTLKNVPQGNYTWYINASGNASNINKSVRRRIFFDFTAPKNTSRFDKFNCVQTQSCTFFKAKVTDNMENSSSINPANITIQVHSIGSNQNFTSNFSTSNSSYNYVFSTSWSANGTREVQKIFLKDRSGNTRTINFQNMNFSVQQLAGGSPGATGSTSGSGTTAPTGASPTTTITSYVTNFLATYGATYTDQQKADLLTSLQAQGVTIDAATLDTYIALVQGAGLTPSAGSGSAGSGMTATGSSPITVVDTTSGLGYVIATVPEGSGSYHLLYRKPSQTREFKILFYNKGSANAKIDLNCDDTGSSNFTGRFCGNVRLSQTEIILPPNDQVKKYILVYITTPADAKDGDTFYFQVLTNDQLGHPNSIGFRVDMSELGIFTEFTDKAKATYTIPLDKLNPKATNIDVPKGVVAGLAGAGLTIGAILIGSIALPVVPAWFVVSAVASWIVTSPIILSLIP